MLEPKRKRPKATLGVWALYGAILVVAVVLAAVGHGKAHSTGVSLVGFVVVMTCWLTWRSRPE